MRSIEKMIHTFLMVSMYSITVESLGQIELGALAVGVKIWCFFCHTLCVMRSSLNKYCRHLRIDFDCFQRYFGRDCRFRCSR